MPLAGGVLRAVWFAGLARDPSRWGMPDASGLSSAEGAAVVARQVQRNTGLSSAMPVPFDMATGMPRISSTAWRSAAPSSRTGRSRMIA